MVAGTENLNAGHVVQFHGHEKELFTRTFAFSPDAPALARHFAVGTLRRLGVTEVAGDAALVVTELAANAIVHAQSAFTVDLAVRPDLLRIWVRDASPLPRAAADPALPAGPLHGLGAVNALASRWGIEPLGAAGKAVWAELPRPPRAAMSSVR